MAAKLQCEICGGKLIGRPGGIYECENCGMEFDTAWAKAKFQEITGTVKVEGTVEVTGKVQVDSTANKEALLQRGMLALEDGDWDKAKEFFNRALDLDAQYAEAYLGLAMIDLYVKSKNELQEKYVSPLSSCRENKHLERARLYGDGRMRSWFGEMDSELAEQKKNREKYLRRNIQNLEPLRAKLVFPMKMIAVGTSHTVGLKADGNVLAVGKNRNGQCDVSKWTDIIAVAAGSNHTVGLKADGTVLAVGDNSYGQCKVNEWTDIVAVAAGRNHTVGLKADGTVVATSITPVFESCGQSSVSKWHDIVAIAAGTFHTVGLKRDGTVIATTIRKTSGHDVGQSNVDDWTDIVAIAAGMLYTIGLKADGTVVGTGSEKNTNDYWIDIVAICGGEYPEGIKTDGKLNGFASNSSEWSNLIAVSAGSEHIVGLRADGTVVARLYKTAKNTYPARCDVGNWRLFDDFNTLDEAINCRIRKAIAQRAAAEAERKAAAEKAEAERKAKIDKLNEEKQEREARRVALEQELPTFTGIFKTGKRKEAEAELARINTRLAEIEAELKKLG